MKLNYCTNTTVRGHEIFHPDDIRDIMRQHYADNKLYIVIDNKQPDNRLGVHMSSDMMSLCAYLEKLFFDGNIIIRAFDKDDERGIMKFIKNNVDMSNYPLGAKDDPRAPWNEKPIRMKEVEVEVVLTVSRNVSLKVPIDADVLDVSIAVENYIDNVYNDKDWIVNEIDWNKI